MQQTQLIITKGENFNRQCLCKRVPLICQLQPDQPELELQVLSDPTQQQSDLMTMHRQGQLEVEVASDVKDPLRRAWLLSKACTLTKRVLQQLLPKHSFVKIMLHKWNLKLTAITVLYSSLKSWDRGLKLRKSLVFRERSLSDYPLVGHLLRFLRQKKSHQRYKKELISSRKLILP